MPLFIGVQKAEVLQQLEELTVTYCDQTETVRNQTPINYQILKQNNSIQKELDS